MDDKKDTDEERLPYCTTAPSAEHARARDEDGPCDDGRAGKGEPSNLTEEASADTNDNEELCEKIRALYPEIGECGMDINVNWNNDKKIWVINFKSGGHELTTHLEPEDANACMEGRKCAALDTEIAKLKAHLGGCPRIA